MPPSRRPSRPPRPHWPELLRSLILCLLVAIAQQGAALHELSHYTGAESSSGPKAPTHAGEVCDLCVAFAQVAATATAPIAAAALLTGLTQPPAASLPWTQASAEAPTARSRGPPSFL